MSAGTSSPFDLGPSGPVRGWYADPETGDGARHQRYWDGRRWTAQRRGPAPDWLLLVEVTGLTVLGVATGLLTWPPGGAGCPAWTEPLAPTPVPLALWLLGVLTSTTVAVVATWRWTGLTAVLCWAMTAGTLLLPFVVMQFVYGACWG